MYKLLSIIVALFMMISCDTGYDGTVIPENEVFNYTYPLEKGNVWEYLVKDQKMNFSNDSLAQIIGIDTLNFYKIKEICSDTVTVSGEITFKIETFETARTHSALTVDTTTYSQKGTKFCNNAQSVLWQYGTNNEPFTAPRPILKYGFYIGYTWNYLVDDFKIIKTIKSFSNIGNQRACLINTNTTSAQTGFSYCNTDGHYSQKGLIKERVLVEDIAMTTPLYPLGGIGTVDFVTTKELIRTNAK